MNQKDTDFFRPLWRRVAVIAVVAGWFGFEVLFSHDQLWMTLTGLALVYAVWNFIIRWPRDEPTEPDAIAPPAEPGPDEPPKA